MYKVQQNTLQKALAMLRAVNCKFLVIDSENNKFGDLEVVEKSTKKRNLLYPRGELKSYIDPYLRNIAIGEVVEIPYGKYAAENLQGSTAGYMCHKYGNGAHTSSQNHDKKVLEVMRML
jgi:hypothetical protein